AFKRSTHKQYDFVLRSHIIRGLGAMRLCDLKREHFQQFLRAKSESGLAWETVAHIRNVLNKMLDSAVEWGYANSNPARLTKLPKRSPKSPRVFLTSDQAHKLLYDLREPVWTIALLLIVTGARIGELLALRWGRVDLENGILQIREGVYDGHFGTPKTQSSVADLPLGPEALA